jgi:threonine dehydrogenase-like Zn-dependent dehydrogenase
VQALVVTPGTAGSARVEELPAPRPAPGEVLLRTLEVGVCGTDAEIAAGHFGTAPPGTRDLVLGHELLGEVVEGAGAFRPGDLVAATVRRSCGRCAACAAGATDSCLTGDYTERGITRLHGFASELAAESPEHLVAVPRELGRLGVLVEPASICSRGLRHARAVGERQPWEPRRALVLGAGAIGLLSACFLRLDGLDVVLASLESAGSAKAETASLAGVRYVSRDDVELAGLGRFDLVVDATGDAEATVAALGLLARNGVACLLGLDTRGGAVPLERRTLGLDFLLAGNAAVASVNAHPQDWAAGVGRLVELLRRLPEAAERLVGLRVDPDGFAEAFAFRGGKATLRFA